MANVYANLVFLFFQNISLLLLSGCFFLHTMNSSQSDCSWQGQCFRVFGLDQVKEVTLNNEHTNVHKRKIFF